MSSRPESKKGLATDKLKDDARKSLLQEQEITYRPVPRAGSGGGSRPVWRLRFELASDRSKVFGLDVNGEVVLGRGRSEKGLVDLTEYGAGELGVSRQHATLRPTATKLFLLDKGATNGTQLGGRSIGVNTPYSLSNGDLLALGQLEFVVWIIKRPTGHTAALRQKADLGEVLAQLAKAITAQLALDEVLSQTLEMAMGLTSAGETAVWLVDEATGELFLEAARGIEEDEIRRMRLPVTDSLAGEVIQSGKPVRASREPEGEQIKVKTGYLVEALLYVPLTLGDVTFGVLAAAHRELGQEFSERDEALLSATADFAAIAIQNARAHQAVDEALGKRVGELTELHSALAHDLRGPLAGIKGYAQMLRRFATVDDRGEIFVKRIVEISDGMLGLVTQLLDVDLMSQTQKIEHGRCDVKEIVGRVLGELEGAALAESIELDFELEGTSYPIVGDSQRLYRSVLNLVDNAIKYSPSDTSIAIVLKYDEEEITLRVSDEGPGIPEDDLPRIFDKFFRAKHKSANAISGAGLGLALVRATARAHGGDVTAKNLKPKGAEFVLSLPGGLKVK